MPWLSLIVAGLCEALLVTMMNEYRIKRSWKPIALLIIGFGASLVLLGYALRFLPMGTAYAIWTGIGVIGGTIIGMVFYGESKDWRRVLSIGIILVAVIGLKLIS